MSRCANKRGSLMTGFTEWGLILTSLFECLFIFFYRSDRVLDWADCLGSRDLI